MANKYIRGYKEKQIYRNERFNKGVVSTNDPLTEGSFRRMINFEVSNQNASLGNREPFLTIPLYDKSNKEIELSRNAFVFTLNDSTNYAYILDLKQNKLDTNLIKPIYLLEDIEIDNKDNYIIDGDTISIKGNSYRLAIIDAPELNDKTFEPIKDIELDDDDFEDMGNQAKKFVKEELEGKTFNVLQYEFQSEKIDEFGRKIVFIEYVGEGEEEETKILNVELMKKGLAMFYGQTSFETNKDYYIPDKILLKNGEYKLFDNFKEAYETSEINSAASVKYCGVSLNLLPLYLSNDHYFKYEKPVVYKIKKETDLQNTEILSGNKSEFKKVKRVLETIEINELPVKQDLEIANDMSLKYVLESKDYTIVNGKYADQYINFLVNVIDIFGKSLYKGIIELTHNNENTNEGIRESFKLRTYNKPEAHIEIQDLTNYKPNILDASSIIPKTLTSSLANAKGYTTPSVDVVLVQSEFNKNLEFSNDDEEEVFKKYFQTNSIINNDLDKINIIPYYKAPNIYYKKDNEEKIKKYMYRWDLVNLKELELSEPEDIKKAKPFFRSSWADLYNQENISLNETRAKEYSLKVSNFKTANDFYIITTSSSTDYDPNVSLEDIDGIDSLNSSWESYILNQETNQMKENLEIFFNKGSDVYTFKTNKKKEILEALSSNEKEDSISIELENESLTKKLSAEEIKNIFKSEENKNKKICFLYLPLKIKMEDTENKKDIITYNNTKTLGVIFDLKTKENYQTVLPIDLNIKELKDKNLIPQDLFDEGIQATFYLTTYEEVKDLKEPDEFYDVLAYKRSSATYTFAKAKGSYKREDFINDRLRKESDAIQSSRFLTSHEDKLIAYGNKEYANTIFISEEGAPYYFSLSNVFEFDHEVIHVQPFKNILMVFTINDIWVIYQVEEDASYQDQEGKVIQATRLSYRYKKILYNISTEEKNKVTIKNITRYTTLLSNDVLYLIKPSAYIADETEFSLNILSKNIDAIVRDPLTFINERLKYYEIFKFATDYELNLNATDNYIKLYYSTEIENKHYTLILTYDILNNRWYEEDTISFGYPERIYLLDSSTGYEMLTRSVNGNLYLTYQTDKYNNMMLNDFKESYYDFNPDGNFPIKYFLDTGYLKINEHFKKRFKSLLYTIKNIDSRKILFTYNFTIDDRQFHSNFEPTYTVNNNNQIIEILQEKKVVTSDIELLLKMKEQATVLDTTKLYKIIEESKTEIGTLDNFMLDFSNLEIGDIMTVKQNLLGNGRLPRIQMGFTTSNRFYILSYGIIYSEQGSKNI